MELWQKILVSCIPLLIVPIVFGIFHKKLNKKNDKIETDEISGEDTAEITEQSKQILKIPSFLRNTMLVCFLGFSVCEGIALIFDPEEWPALIIGLCFFQVPFISFFICWSLWKVEIYKDRFVYRNYFGIKREYKFCDLEYVMHPKGLKWYFYKDGKKVFCMAYFIENGDKLYRVYRKYKSKNKQSNT